MPMVLSERFKRANFSRSWHCSQLLHSIGGHGHDLAPAAEERVKGDGSPYTSGDYTNKIGSVILTRHVNATTIICINDPYDYPSPSKMMSVSCVFRAKVPYPHEASWPVSHCLQIQDNSLQCRQQETPPKLSSQNCVSPSNLLSGWGLYEPVNWSTTKTAWASARVRLTLLCYLFMQL